MWTARLIAGRVRYQFEGRGGRTGRTALDATARYAPPAGHARGRRDASVGEVLDPPRWVIVVFVLGILAGSLLADDAEAAVHSAEAAIHQSAPPPAEVEEDDEGEPEIKSTRIREEAIRQHAGAAGSAGPIGPGGDAAGPKESGPRGAGDPRWPWPLTSVADRLPGELDVIIIARIVAGESGPRFERQAHGAWLGDTGYAVCAFHQIRGLSDPLVAGESAGEAEPTRLFVVYVDPMRDLALLCDSPNPPPVERLRTVDIAPPPPLGSLVASYPGPRPPGMAPGAEGPGAGDAEGPRGGGDPVASAGVTAAWNPEWGMVTHAPPIPRATIGIVWTTALSAAGMSGSPVYDAESNRPFGLISAAGWQRNGIAALAPFLEGYAARGAPPAAFPLEQIGSADGLTPPIAWILGFPPEAVLPSPARAVGTSDAPRGQGELRSGGASAAADVPGPSIDARRRLLIAASAAGMAGVVSDLLDHDSDLARHINAPAGAGAGSGAGEGAGAEAERTADAGRVGPTALMLAVSPAGSRPTVVRLLEAGADPGRRDRRGRTALHHAVAAGRADLVDLLLAAVAAGAGAETSGDAPPLSPPARGTDRIVNQADEDGLTPLLIAARAADPEMIDRLLTAGADPRASDRFGRGPLHHAVLSFSPSAEAALERLLMVVADAGVDAQDAAGDTALASAASLGKIALLRRLLDAGAEPNRANRAGLTPVHHAAVNGGERASAMLQALMAAGGDPNRRTRDGRSAFDVLIAREAELVEPLLRRLATRGGGGDESSADRDALTDGLPGPPAGPRHRLGE